MTDRIAIENFKTPREFGFSPSRINLFVGTNARGNPNSLDAFPVLPSTAMDSR